LVPSFAVGRAQQILFHLDELFCSGRLDPFPIYLDSPMAIQASAVYKQHPDLFDEEALKLQNCEFSWGGQHLHSVPTAEGSMALNDVAGPCLIVAGSGMCTGGRILHHLRHNLARPERLFSSSVIKAKDRWDASSSMVRRRCAFSARPFRSTLRSTL
jgi:metallo-beta-lactamase family protein